MKDKNLPVGSASNFDHFDPSSYIGKNVYLFQVSIDPWSFTLPSGKLT